MASADESEWDIEGGVGERGIFLKKRTWGLDFNGIFV